MSGSSGVSSFGQTWYVVASSLSMTMKSSGIFFKKQRPPSRRVHALQLDLLMQRSKQTSLLAENEPVRGRSPPRISMSASIQSHGEGA